MNTMADVLHQSEEFCHRFALAEIQSATNNFDDALVIGSGGFGKVYKGFITDGATTVAIKRLNAESKQGAKEFWSEISILSKLRHTHLVSLIGYCDDCEEMILVYEYMVNGTLADHLYKFSRKRNGNDIYYLTWEQRLKICISAARGLDYLHNTEQSVIHRDVKPSNILLDENWIAKISDFGLSRRGSTSQTQTHVSTDVKGTFGYLDPEYFLTRRLTKKSDVYAFGVVLFEVLCSRPAVDLRVEEEQCNLAIWAQQCIKKGALDQIIDPTLRGQISAHHLKVFTAVANKCLHNHPRGRPTMAEVVENLELLLASKGNIPQRKTTITKVLPNIAHVVAKGIDLGWRKWRDCGYKNGLSWWLRREPYVDNDIHSYRRLSLAEIRAATRNFHENLVVGDCEYIKFYRGHMDRGNLEVLIKRWKEGTAIKRNLDEFWSEMQLLSHLHHVHIVSLIGYCNDKHEVILVYEYMSKGPLYRFLHEPNNYLLPWEKRLEICIGVARGLQYLHAGAKQTIIHRNVKPTRILLDENWVAKVSVNSESASALDTFDAGTVGYMDPEYLATAKLTVKSDVYSFGVLLLELLCGRKPMIFSRDEDEVNLVRWFKTNIEMGTIDQIIDPYLIHKIVPECLKEYVRIAENCVRDEGMERPLMDDVLGSLRLALQLQKAGQIKLSEVVPHSHSNTFSNDDVVVEIGSRGGTRGMSYRSLADSDYYSGNLAR
ncbi:probable LRR receptor-like serine/threonine-protein kinase MEE39 [Actinidia eriantha]|uniref:probable LRR receptor-like serine/threonine-protein kinase MEE39 n=1 Tax=Actinidia eriantha TaxID=165200 RepID=UPI0025877E61|nr:probable LRR receptor-like serine/threonine-protein kinase MEE39 [Actinidia eriantha]